MNRALERFLLSTPYTSATGQRRRSLLDVYGNFLLLDAGVRPSFLLSGLDYRTDGLALSILSLALKAGYVLIPSGQGELLCTPDKARSVKRWVTKYEDTRDPEMMGRALGYPAAHDFPSPFTPGRKSMSWWVKWPGGRVEHQLMANVFLDEDLIALGELLADEMTAALDPFGLEVVFRVKHRLRPPPERYRKYFGG